MAEKQTAGHDLLGDFAPQFAKLNDEVLFGEIWSREKELSARDRSMITVSALIAGGNFEQLTPQIIRKSMSVVLIHNYFIAMSCFCMQNKTAYHPFHFGDRLFYSTDLDFIDK